MDSELTIEFGVGGNGVELTREGWSTPEPDICWMVGTESAVVFGRPMLGLARYQIILTIRPHVRGSALPKQALIVAVNDVLIGVREVSKDETIEFEVPHYAFELNDVVRIRFIHPNYASPRQIAEVNDDRLLAVALERLVLKTFAISLPASTVDEAGAIKAVVAEAGVPELRNPPQARVVRRPPHVSAF